MTQRMQVVPRTCRDLAFIPLAPIKAQHRRDERHARRIATERAQEQWPGNVNAILRALADKAASHEARIAALEARLG